MSNEANNKNRTEKPTSRRIDELLESESKRNFEKRNTEYLSYVEAKSPKGSWLKSLFHAFLVGGTICCFGQLIGDIFKAVDPIMNYKTVASWINIIIITLIINKNSLFLFLISLLIIFAIKITNGIFINSLG